MDTAPFAYRRLAAACFGGWVRCDFRERWPASPPELDGWKIHVSVEAARVADAWDAILPVIMDAALHAKACGPEIVDRIGDPDHRQAGKTIVIYGGGHPNVGDPSFWRDVLSRIEDGLRGAAIAHGWTVAGDRPVTGSAYSHVRNDTDVHGRYLPADGRFNPSGFPCPFDAVVLASGRPVPRAAESARDTVRQLGFVGGIWQADETEFVSEPTGTLSTGLASTLASHGVPTTARGDGSLSVPSAAAGCVAAGWFGAMYQPRSRRFAVALAEGWHEATGDYPLVLPLSGGDRPVIGLEFREDDEAQALAEMLRSAWLGSPFLVEDSRLFLPTPSDAFRGADVPRGLSSRIADLAAAKGLAAPRP